MQTQSERTIVSIPSDTSGTFSSWNFASGSVQRPAEPTGPVIPEPIQEDVLTRLNSTECEVIISQATVKY